MKPFGENLDVVQEEKHRGKYIEENIKVITNQNHTIIFFKKINLLF